MLSDDCSIPLVASDLQGLFQDGVTALLNLSMRWLENGCVFLILGYTQEHPISC